MDPVFSPIFDVLTAFAVLGGGVLVGLAYWFIYLRGRASPRS